MATMYPDYLTCGRCAEEYPLSKIDDFILHKTSCLQTSRGQKHYSWESSPAVLPQPPLSCYICMQEFHTARGVLQHVQNVHNVGIFVQKLENTAFSARQPFVEYNRQVASTSCAVQSDITDGMTRPSVAITTAFAGDYSVSAAETSAEVSVSSSKQSAMPVACAKIASSEGTTICCNGKECQVTVNPQQKTLPPKKRRSVFPKKRNRHFQEHDSEDMEQTALETLATLRSRCLLNQKSRSCTKKGARVSFRSREKGKSHCVMRCRREEVCVEKASDVCKVVEEQEEEEHCPVTDVEDRQDSDEDSEDETGKKQQKIEIYSVEKESITNRKTVITNSAMTVTLEPTGTAASKQGQEDEIVQSSQAATTRNHSHSVPSMDISRESAQILAELIQHTAPPVDQPVMMPVQNWPVNTADSQAAAMSLADSSVTNSFLEPITSNLLSVNNSSTPSNSVSFNNSLNPLVVNTNLIGSLDTNIPVSAIPAQLAATPQLDMQQLPDLDSLTPTIQSFPSLGHISQHTAALAIPDITASFSSEASSSQSPSDSTVDGSDGRKGGMGKKRRYPTSRPHKCSQCDLAFNQAIHLKKHMSKHTGVKPFKCEQCDYSTVERSHLKAHNRIHTGEKPFRCQFCNYATAQNSTLRVHLKRHHQDQQTATSVKTMPSPS